MSDNESIKATVHIKRIPVTPIVTALCRSSYTLIWVRVYALVVFLFTLSSFLTSLIHSSKVLFIRKLLLCVEQTENKKVYFHKHVFYRRCFIDIGLHVRKKNLTFQKWHFVRFHVKVSCICLSVIYVIHKIINGKRKDTFFRLIVAPDTIILLQNNETINYVHFLTFLQILRTVYVISFLHTGGDCIYIYNWFDNEYIDYTLCTNIKKTWRD